MSKSSCEAHTHIRRRLRHQTHTGRYTSALVITGVHAGVPPTAAQLLSVGPLTNHPPARAGARLSRMRQRSCASWRVTLAS
eukprot:2648492-Pyramimonas_sp.AAC.1